jgi:hypothetical protein
VDAGGPPGYADPLRSLVDATDPEFLASRTWVGAYFLRQVRSSGDESDPDARLRSPRGVTSPAAVSRVGSRARCLAAAVEPRVRLPQETARNDEAKVSVTLRKRRR